MKPDVFARLERYSARALGGALVVDVPLCAAAGGWPAGTADHRIDGVLVHGAPSGLLAASAVDDLSVMFTATAVTLVAAQGYADRPLLGWLLAGSELFSRSYQTHGLIRQVVLVDGAAPEPNMGWVYAHVGVEVVALDG